MEKALIFPLPGNDALATVLANELAIPIGTAEVRQFPDEESYIRIDSNVKNKMAILICSLDHPNNKFLPLFFMAQTLKELGANKICLIAPYLPYLRQDKRFKSGEAITSTLFANFLSRFIDHLITIDPHLHRIHQLSEIYTLSSISTLHATHKIAQWVQTNVDSPIIIGPDEESKQWVSEVAAACHAPFIIIKKIRHGDDSVSISVPDFNATHSTPIIVDDIISTGTSMIATLHELSSRGLQHSICIGVHAIFTEHTRDKLLQAGANNVISCNTIAHPSNQIDVTDLIVAAIKQLQIP